MAAKPSLQEFVVKQRFERYPCSVCLLPPEILKQVNEAQAAGEIGHRLIGKWLFDLGHTIPRSTLERHKENHLSRKR